MTRRAFFGGISTLLLTASLVSGAATAEDIWTARGPQSMSVASIAVDPVTPSTVYAAGTLGGPYAGALVKSTDGGREWTALGAGTFTGPVHSVVIDPTAPDALYVGHYNGLFKSLDGGRTWGGPMLKDRAVGALAVDPKTPSTIYVGLNEDGWGGSDSMFRSDNGGADWSNIDFAKDASVISITLDPTAPATIYANGERKTTDGGEPEHDQPSGSLRLPFRRSRPPRFGALPGRGLRNWAVDFFRSVDGGSTWTQALDSVGHVRALAVDSRTTPSTIYAGTDTGVFRSRDGGMHWTSFNDGLGKVTVTTLAISSAYPVTLYAGTEESGVYQMQLETVTASYLLPSSARAPGAHGAFYTTDLTIANRGATDAGFTIQFLGHDADGRTGPTSTLRLASNRAVTYTDVLGSLFGVTTGYGAIRITSDSASLKVAGLTSTPPPDGRGSVGQSVPAFTDASYATPASPRSLIGLREDATFRTNLVLANASDFAVQVVLSLVGSDGVTLGTATRDLPPLGMTQVPSVVTALGGASGTRDAVLVVAPTTAGAQVAAYATVTDNATNDPRTVLP